MTAEPLHTTPAASWPVPPQDGYTVDDLFRLPDLPPHTELIDGSLVFVSPQRSFHCMVMYLLESGLHSTVPSDLRVRREMNVVIDKRQAPEPDLLVIRAEAATSTKESCYDAKDVELVVEVVSPDSEVRDRKRKPQLYAEAGIRHFWRVECGEDERPVVYVYELDEATKAYGLTGIHHDHLKLTVPFTIDIDLTEIDHL
ncbi:Uma2 family endonuclease [Streptomyces sp. 110]|uniref:Uma2 family endonuclease n=1 Tax=Streptomyces endocoffeicus TaxID=2898945 RepID=A0ABS1PQI5_9ACTN|nr:Uma2 family endonuclease [Streptomyces endocoffeicus]MBL1114539.1 Uma2 family endonuclease [Streptomyces endocoffeicus]